MNFGFWTALFDAQYEHGRADGPRLWPHLAKAAFAHAPKRTRNRAALSRVFHDLRHFRNRLAHHEPIDRWQPLRTFQNVCDVIGWMNPSVASLLTIATGGRMEVLDRAGPAMYLSVTDELGRGR